MGSRLTRFVCAGLASLMASLGIFFFAASADAAKSASDA